MAASLVAPWLPSGTNYAVSNHWAGFDGQHALGFSGLMRISGNFVFSGGFAAGLDRGKLSTFTSGRRLSSARRPRRILERGPHAEPRRLHVRVVTMSTPRHSHSTCHSFEKSTHMKTSIARSLSRWLACAIVTAATAAGLPFVPSASAADMPAQARPAVVVAAPLWTGFYIGVHGGGGWASTLSPTRA